METDKNLVGNKLIEDAIEVMYKNMNDLNFAKLLETIRARMKDGGHLVIAVKPSEETNNLELRPVTTDGKQWIAAFTSFEEEIKRKDAIVSGFTAEIGKLFDIILGSDAVNGLIINPWDKAIKLDKRVIKIVKGQSIE